MTQRRLLVLDDEPEFCEYVRTVAEQEDYLVETIQDSRKFQELFESFDPTLIVLDLVMPDMDGIEIIRWLSSKERPIHVVLATGYDPRYAIMADKLAMGRSKNLKISPIAKPVRVDTLRRILQKTQQSGEETR
ncbi:response regulator [Pelagibius sp. Alg239-R121]|uniref:response regulator n=1 Tax=Pelagibius sp. Alg239-R121 TaxID=2993448 RepID=UPI0024A6B0BF|nr:response regulator [Pelagibius sp. Alg239-R121]